MTTINLIPKSTIIDWFAIDILEDWLLAKSWIVNALINLCLISWLRSGPLPILKYYTLKISHLNFRIKPYLEFKESLLVSYFNISLIKDIFWCDERHHKYVIRIILRCLLIEIHILQQMNGTTQQKNCSLKTHLLRISSLFPQTNDNTTKHTQKDLETCHIFFLFCWQVYHSIHQQFRRRKKLWQIFMVQKLHKREHKRKSVNTPGKRKQII